MKMFASHRIMAGSPRALKNIFLSPHELIAALLQTVIYTTSYLILHAKTAGSIKLICSKAQFVFQSFLISTSIYPR